MTGARGRRNATVRQAPKLAPVTRVKGLCAHTTRKPTMSISPSPMSLSPHQEVLQVPHIGKVDPKAFMALFVKTDGIKEFPLRGGVE